MSFGKGILSEEVIGIDKAYGMWNNRVVGDVCNDNAAWVNFNSLGHKSNVYDFFYEMSIPLSELGITKSDIATNGVGVLLVATFGKSGLDCLPYDIAMNDNADLSDAEYSQELNSYEKSDADNITTTFAYIGKTGSGPSDPPVNNLELNFGADRSSPQLESTTLTLNGIAEGGTAPYTYEFKVNGETVATESESGQVSTSWTPEEGTYIIECVVTDSADETVTSAKYYYVEKEECKHSETTLRNQKEATCIQKGYTGDTHCAECDELISSGSETPVSDHNWDDGTVTKKATTTETGVMTYKCTTTGCVATKTETIPPISSSHEHTWEEGVVTKEATETEEGVLTYTCTGCTATTTEAIPKKTHVHKWDEGKVTKEPTATEKGIKTYNCTGCTAVKTEDIPATGNGSTGGNTIGGNTTGGNATGDTTVKIPREGERFDDSSSKMTYRVTNGSANKKEVEVVIGNAKAKKVVIPATVKVGNVVFKVTSISGGAFKNNKYMKSVVIGENVKIIGEGAFQNCKKLASVTMGKNVTTIGNHAFYKCIKLKSITIPSKVKSIGKKAFYGCKNLKKITIKTTKLTKKNVGSKAFKGINSKAMIKVPKKKLASYKKMLKSKGVGSKVTVKKNCNLQ